jgi:Siphovirus ReqiPepy6 Gp37-like protein
MQIHTLNRKFLKQDVIDEFLSAIWTERYYGDSAVEMVVPATSEMIKKLPEGIFLGLAGSNEIMIVETVNIEEGHLKVSGISLLPWLNNRFIRTSAKHEDQYWYLGENPGETPGWMLWAIVYYMCVAGSPYLNGTIPIGIPNPEQLAIPGLGLKDFDKSGSNVKIGIPYGPVYDAMREIATTYQIGMQITLESATDTSYSLGFRSYKGLDHTSGQTVNPVVRFSPQMDSLTDIKELRSIATLKTIAYAFAPGLNPAEGEPELRTVPGVANLTGPQYTGFDLRAQMVFASDITTDMIGGVPARLVDILNARAQQALAENHFVKAVDGEIVSLNQFKYGIHYNLGDVIEVQGNSEVVQTSRVTEYIRAQDAAGERAYPTVAMLS